MGEVLQKSEIMKLYCENYEKPELSDETLAHYGVLGMKWGIRKDRRKTGGSIRKKRSKKSKMKVYKDPKEAIEAKDLKYINANRSLFSTKEINQVLGRIDAERRLSEVSKDYGESKTKKKVKKMMNSKSFKIIAGVTIGALGLATSRYVYDIWWRRPRLIGKRSLGKDVVDLGKGAMNLAKYNLVPFAKYFKGL